MYEWLDFIGIDIDRQQLDELRKADR